MMCRHRTELNRIVEPGRAFVDMLAFPCKSVAASERKSQCSCQNEHGKLASDGCPDAVQVSGIQGQERRCWLFNHGNHTWGNLVGDICKDKSSIREAGEPSITTHTIVANIPPIPPKAMIVAVDTDRFVWETMLLAFWIMRRGSVQCQQEVSVDSAHVSKDSRDTSRCSCICQKETWGQRK